ncbi:MAG: hypothetical protein EZS28_037672 [Streblomastix strix]|uniref:Uncharacterized protein n=1 Tax=Streblomastix strix TaxID=222440 RepID=A0A5J4UA72_9EUKA|nr:MAG: hypothetical protein EZS28_037672 [Streblomastix strix]
MRKLTQFLCCTGCGNEDEEDEKIKIKETINELKDQIEEEGIQEEVDNLIFHTSRREKIFVQSNAAQLKNQIHRYRDSIIIEIEYDDDDQIFTIKKDESKYETSQNKDFIIFFDSDSESDYGSDDDDSDEEEVKRKNKRKKKKMKKSVVKANKKTKKKQNKPKKKGKVSRKGSKDR